MRAKGNRIQVFDLLAQQATFQTCVDGYHLRLLPKHLFIDIHHSIPQRGILSVLPSRVHTSVDALCIVACGNGFQLFCQFLLFKVGAAAKSKGHFKAFIQLQNAQVQAGLHQTGNILRPGLDTIGNFLQKGDHLIRIFTGDGIATQGIYAVTTDDGFRLIKVCPDLSLQGRSYIVDLLQIHTHSNQGCFAGTGNGVILCAALQLGQAQGHQFSNTGKKLTHHLIGICKILVDLHTGVAALQVFHNQLNARAVNCPTG